jgi:uncharacterized protein (TIGR03435 family)
MTAMCVSQFLRLGTALCLGVLVAGSGAGESPAVAAAPQTAIVALSPAQQPSLTPPVVVPIGTPPEELPTFEVASVKKLSGPVTSSTLRTPGGGRIQIVNLPLRTIVMQAFGIRDYQLSGGPNWMTSDRFTINAKAETNVPRDQLMLMVRHLLAERFQMKWRSESRIHPSYVLITAEEEWKPTARMKEVDCTATRGAAPTPSAGPVRLDPNNPCAGMTSLSTAGIVARGVTMTSFASLLGSLGGLGLIHDRTGLTGTYYIELDASPTALLRSLSASQITSSDNLLPTVGDGRSLSSAVQDLGLKLERRREPVDVLVIDSVSQPDED